ncbi:MAG: hypothetical protein R3B74_11430 [Nitrospirales bacterium]|nr:hypothetical protein [Nitrospirales bacterium]
MRQQFSFHDSSLILEVQGLDEMPPPYLVGLLFDFCWEPYSGDLPSLLRLEIIDGSPPPSSDGLASQEVFKLPDGVRLSFFGKNALIQLHDIQGRLKFSEGRCSVYVNSQFPEYSPEAFCSFWMAILISLLQSRETYMIHAAGLGTPEGEGVIFVAPSGSGKSTLTLGLIRKGWTYLSDDILFLRSSGACIEAFAGRKTFYVVKERAEQYEDWPFGESDCPDRDGNPRQEILVHQRYPMQFHGRTRPGVVVLPAIVRRSKSCLIPLERGAAIKDMLRESSIGLTGQQILPGQLAVISRLVGQCQVFRLEAGKDLYQHPEFFSDLLTRQSIRS